MPRKRLIVKREAFVDPKYKSRLVAKFINCMMYKGKKNTAQSIIYKSFDIMRDKSKEDPLVLFEKAINNVKPLVEVRERISEELAKIESKENIVPIDRDPVPERYSELVRAYYENLGGDN